MAASVGTGADAGKVIMTSVKAGKDFDITAGAITGGATEVGLTGIADATAAATATASFAKDLDITTFEGAQKALEPMSPPDRKVVHDTVNEIEGVSTVSEGEEPRRRVVIVPAD